MMVAGHARIFDWDGSTWSQRGEDIDGEAVIDFSGRRTRLSADGNTIAVAGFLNDGNGLDSGHVRMYDWNGSSWAQRGADIDGSSAGDQSGYSISLSADGNTLAVGSLVNDTGGQDSGQTRIFDWNGAAWQQRGADIYGEAEGDISSRGLSLSADGNTVAIGAPYNDGNGDDAGHVRIYDWNGTVWLPRGLDIDGENAGDFSGWAISLNGSGNIVAIGAVSDDGTGIDSGQTRDRLGSTSGWPRVPLRSLSRIPKLPVLPVPRAHCPVSILRSARSMREGPRSVQRPIGWSMPPKTSPTSL